MFCRLYGQLLIAQKSVSMEIAHCTLDLTSRMTKIKDHALFWAVFEGSRCLLIMHGSQEQAPALKIVIKLLVKLKRCVKIQIRLDYSIYAHFICIFTNSFKKKILVCGIFFEFISNIYISKWCTNVYMQ